VTKAAVGNALPLLTQGDVWGSEMPVPGDPAIKQQVRANFRMVSPDYFAAMRIRLLEGRLLAETDTPDTPPVLVVDRAFARRYLGSVHVGARIPIKFGDGRPDATVVGVVDDMRQGDVLDPQTAEMFVSYRQTPAWLQRGSMVFVVRTAGDPIAALPMLRTAVHEQDPDVALDSAMTMEERLTTSLAKPRLYALLLTGLAVAALTIAGVGLFGVLSYAVAQRSREIGVRAALGAQLVHILGLVARQAVAVVASGLAVGILLSVAASRFVATFLYGVTSHDGASFAASIGIVIIVATVACAVPAWRAAKVDPLVVLRVN
jgi:predicted permease